MRVLKHSRCWRSATPWSPSRRGVPLDTTPPWPVRVDSNSAQRTGEAEAAWRLIAGAPKHLAIARYLDDSRACRHETASS